MEGRSGVLPEKPPRRMSKPSTKTTGNASPDSLENVHPHYVGPFMTRVLGTNAQAESWVITSRRHRKRLQTPSTRQGQSLSRGKRAVEGVVQVLGSELGVLVACPAFHGRIGSVHSRCGSGDLSLDVHPMVASSNGQQLGLLRGIDLLHDRGIHSVSGSGQFGTSPNCRGAIRVGRRHEDAGDGSDGVPRNLGYLASIIQLLGTILFNFDTGDALLSNLTSTEENLAIWTPNVTGSLCFIIATACSYLEVGYRFPYFQAR